MRGRGTTIAAVLATTAAALMALAAAPGAPADRVPAGTGAGTGAAGASGATSAEAATSAGTHGIPAPPPVTAPGRRGCGTVPLYGHRFPLEAWGIGCGQARQLMHRHCTESLDQTWTCASFREELPFVSWFPSADFFKHQTKTAAQLLRYPCSEARVTAAQFQRQPRRSEFPSRRQLLADDAVRCHLLEPGATAAAAEALLGSPDLEEVEHGNLHWRWILCIGRGSDLGLGPELLDLEIAGDEVVAIELGRPD